jgi:hypothetical protein
MNGLNPKPMKSYSLATRLLCSRCGKIPKIVSATGIDVVTLTVECHGERETRTVEKKELVHVQEFFAIPEEVRDFAND